MKRLSVIFLALCLAAFCIPAPVEAQAPGSEVFRQEGIASWYGPEFDGRPTASGEIFNSALFTAAHPTLPFGTVLLVTNQHNNKQVAVKVNDRGPFVPARIIDISKAAAEHLDMLVTGTAPVLIETTASGPYQTRPSPSPVSVSLSPQPPAQTAAPPAAPPVISQAPQNAPPPEENKPQKLSGVKLSPPITPAPNKMYRLQIGSYKVARNAVDVFEKLKTAGLNPAYEQKDDYFRVVLAGISGKDIESVTEKLEAAGFREAVIREDK